MTIKEIAELCGVSRGTVDRVINNRGNVRPEIEARIREVIKKYNYEPNLAGKTLAACKRSQIIGVLLASEGNSFFDEVINGVQKSAKELADFGVKVELHLMRGYDANKQIDIINEMRKRISVLVLHPINEQKIAHTIDELADDRIATVTINSDIENSKRICYVGNDYEKGGKLAAGILALTCDGKGKIGVVKGADNILGHVQRLKGFNMQLQAMYPEIEITDWCQSNDDQIQAYISTSQMLQRQPDLNALFVVAAGMKGVCRAIEETNFINEIKVVGFDMVPETIDAMRKGIVRAVVCQRPFDQGYNAVKVAYDTIITGNTMCRSPIIIENEIKILESL